MNYSEVVERLVSSEIRCSSISTTGDNFIYRLVDNDDFNDTLALLKHYREGLEELAKKEWFINVDDCEPHLLEYRDLEARIDYAKQILSTEGE